jgi:hypothetical protein
MAMIYVPFEMERDKLPKNLRIGMNTISPPIPTGPPNIPGKIPLPNVINSLMMSKIQISFIHDERRIFFPACSAAIKIGSKGAEKGGA